MGCKKEPGSTTSQSGTLPGGGAPITAMVTVLKDCSGVYLRYEGKAYQLCNLQKFTPYNDGATVKATFTIKENCGQLNIFCSDAVYSREKWAQVDAVE